MLVGGSDNGLSNSKVKMSWLMVSIGGTEYGGDGGCSVSGNIIVGVS